MKVDIRNLFRICEPGRKLPTGTLAIIGRDPPPFIVRVHRDDGSKAEQLWAAWAEVNPVPPTTDEDPFPTGTVVVEVSRSDSKGLHVPTGEVRTWHFFKELPVTGERIHQVVVALNALPKVSIPEK